MDAIKTGKVIAKDEMNLAEFALCGVRSREVDDEGKFVVHRGTVWDPALKQHVPRELIIEGSAKFGLPFGTDDDVLLACVKLSREDGFKSRRVTFSAYRVLQELGWSDGGERFDRLRDGLRRWSKIRIHSERHFWDNERKCFYDEDFGIIDTLRVPRSKAERWQLVWSDGFWRSLRSGYVRSLDWELYLSLSSHVAKRLYRLLDKRFYRKDQNEFRFDLQELCVRHVGLSSGKTNTNMKRELMAGINELEAKWDMLAPAPTSERFLAAGRGRWEVVFARASRERRLSVGEQPAKNDDPRRGLIEKLVASGVAVKVATELAGSVPEAKIREKVELVEWLAERKDKRIEKNPAGFLVAAIREDYPLPRGFKTRAVRQAEKAAVEERKRKQDAAAAAELREREAEEAARAAALRDYLAGLSAEARETFEAEAIESDTGFLRQLWRKQADGDGLYLQMMLRNHFERVTLAK